MKKQGIIWELLNRLTKKIKKPDAQPPTPQESYVYITIKGKRYHRRPNCPALKNAKTVKMEIGKARKSGRTACDKCCYDYLRY